MIYEGKGNKSFHPRPEGIDPATQCALIVSIKLNWPTFRNRQAQAMCEALYAAAGGDLGAPGAHQIAAEPTALGEITCVRHDGWGPSTYTAASSHLTYKIL